MDKEIRLSMRSGNAAQSELMQCFADETIENCLEII